MSILITGANGTIGIDLVRMLAIDHKIYAVYRTKNKVVKKIKNVVWIKHDLKKKFNKKFKYNPKYIIHCIVDQKQSKKKNKRNYIDTNINILKNVLSFAKKIKIKLIVNLSSIEIYGNIKKKIVNENSKPQNPNAYGFFKHLSEKILIKQQINFINIRLPGILHEPFKKKYTRPWLNNVFEKMKKNQVIEAHNIKGKFNNVTSTKEIVKFLRFLIKKDILIRDTFNFACSKPIFLNKLFKIVKKKINSKSKIIEIKNSKKNSFCISTNKLEKKLNYKTQSTKKTLEQYLESYI